MKRKRKDDHSYTTLKNIESIGVKSENDYKIPSVILTSLIVLFTTFCLMHLLINSFHIFGSDTLGNVRTHFSDKEISGFYFKAMLLCIPICAVNGLKKYSPFYSTCLFFVYVLYFINHFLVLSNGFIHALNKVILSVSQVSGETPDVYYLTNYAVTNASDETMMFCYAVTFGICFILAFSAIQFSFPFLFTFCVAAAAALPLIFRTLNSEGYFAAAALCCIIVYVMNVQGYRNVWSGRLIKSYGKTVKIHGSYVSFSSFQQAVIVLVCIVLVTGISSIFVDYSGYRLSPKTQAFGDSILDKFEDLKNGLLFGEKESNTLSSGDLRKTGNLSYNGEIMFGIKYENSPKQGSYLRTFTASVYNENKWYDFDNDVYKDYADMWEKLGESGFSPVAMHGDFLGKYPYFEDSFNTITIRRGKLGKKNVITDTRLTSTSPILGKSQSQYDKYPVFSLFGGTGKEYTQNTVDANLSDLVMIQGVDDGVNGSFYSMIHDGGFRLAGVNYSAGMKPVGTPDDEELYAFINNEKLYRQFVMENYLDVPDNITNYVPSRFTTMEKDFIDENYDGIINDYAFASYDYYYYAVGQVKQYLADHAVYSLTPGRIPKDKDFAEYFMNESGEGYCVHFATTGVLMLRYLGIPARYAEGFYVGDQDLHNPDEDGFSSIPDSNAHAWAEVYFPLVGWQPVELTPGYDDTEEPQPEEDSETDSDTESDTDSDEESDAESDSDTNTDEESDSEESTDSDLTESAAEDETDSEKPGGLFDRDDEEGGFKLFYLILVGIGYALYYILKIVLWLVLRWLCMKLREKRFTEEDTRVSVRRMYRYSLFLLWLNRIKVQPKEEDEAFARRAMQKIDSALTADYLKFTETALDSRFGREPVSKERAGEMFDFINKLIKSIYDNSGKIKKFVIKYILFLI